MGNASKAVVYCRVSSARQVTEGNGLASQETRCREYAKVKGYEVLEVFRDGGLSGRLMDRPNMKAMLGFLRKNRNGSLVVVIDDISRLARDIETHIHLRTAIGKANAKLESPSIEFGEDSDSKLIEHLLASVAAHQRDKNAEQTKNRMRARMMGGYAVFNPPPGYAFEKVSGHGNVLVRNEPLASTVAEALEGFATGRFETQCEVKRYLEASPHFPKDRKGEIHYQRIKDMLCHVLYAGYLDKPDWGVRLVKGRHEPLVSFETYEAIQARIESQAVAPARKDIRRDFPLRGFITCGSCGSNMTACWSTGRNGKYPYYLCPQKGCSDYRKSIRKERLEGEFEAMLAGMKPSKSVIAAAVHIFADLWEEKRQNAKRDADDLRRESLRIERKSELLLDRIIEADNQSLVAAYEAKLGKLEADRKRLDERIANCGRPFQSFEDTFRTALGFLSDPQELWHSGVLEHQRTVLKLAFGGKLAYVRNEGFRTTGKPLPFELLEQFGTPDKGMARPTVESSNTLFDILTQWNLALKTIENTGTPDSQIQPQPTSVDERFVSEAKSCP